MSRSLWRTKYEQSSLCLFHFKCVYIFFSLIPAFLSLSLSLSPILLRSHPSIPSNMIRLRIVIHILLFQNFHFTFISFETRFYYVWTTLRCSSNVVVVRPRKIPHSLYNLIKIRRISYKMMLLSLSLLWISKFNWLSAHWRKISIRIVFSFDRTRFFFSYYTRFYLESSEQSKQHLSHGCFFLHRKCCTKIIDWDIFTDR